VCSPAFNDALLLLALLLLLSCTPTCRLDLTFIFLMSIPFALAMSWNVYDTWVGVALNVGMTALVVALGVRHVTSAALDATVEAHK